MAEKATIRDIREQMILILFNRTKKIAEQSDISPAMEARIAENIGLLGRMVDELEAELQP